jgi:two-component system, OmpR family, copper resistance phosphate regulon response regulator CusR
MSRSIADILYLEDDMGTHKLVIFWLTEADYNVVVAKTFAEALLVARKHRFDLFLIDNWIDGGPGIENCKEFRKIDSVTPILFYSGAAFEYDREEALAAGADGYLIKPALNKALIEEVSRLIQLGRFRANAA